MRMRSAALAIAISVFALPMACGSDVPGTVNPPASPAAPPPPPAPPEPVLTDGSGADGVITVDATKRFQVMDGFGTSLLLFDNPHLNGGDPSDLSLQLNLTQAQQDEILTKLYDSVGGIRLNRLRVFPLQPGWQTQRGGPIVADAPYPGPHAGAMMDFAKRARQKNPELQVGIAPTMLDQWVNDASASDIAGYIKSAVDFAVSRGVVPTWVAVQNEPSLTPPRFTPQRVRDIAVELRKKLDAQGSAVGIAAPDDFSDITAEAHLRALFGDDEGRRSVRWVAVHGYESDGPVRTAAFAAQYSLPLWMTEYDDRLLNKETGWAVQTIHNYIVNYNTSAIDMLFGFLSSQGVGNPYATYLTLNSSGKTYLGYTLNPSYFQAGQYSKFVTRGSVRIQATSSNAALKVSAFDVKGKKVMVLINPGRTALSIGIPQGTYRVVRTQMSGSDRLTNKGLFTGAITLPSASIATLIEQ